MGVKGLTTMPAKRGPAPAGIHLGKGMATLTLTNHGTPLVWQLGLYRYPVQKAAASVLAKDFDVHGGAQFNPMVEPFDVDAQPGAQAQDAMVQVEQGQAEFGLLTEDELEYFFSKGSGLTGIVRFKRGKDGETWSAQVAKDNLPRVLSPEAVKHGLVPPQGQSALPMSLETIIPAEFRYWEAETPEQAVQVRDALVESGFLTNDTIKVVDGELRKVEVRYFLFEPEAEEMREVQLRAPRSTAEKVLEQVPTKYVVESPLAATTTNEGHAIAKVDEENVVVVLSAPDDRPLEELTDLTNFVLKGQWLIETEDTAANREALGKLGPTFKLHGEPTRLFATSFPPAMPARCHMVTKETGGFGVDNLGYHPSGASLESPDTTVGVTEPFGGFGDFDACLAAQQSKGHSDDAARRICGALQRDTEKRARRRKTTSFNQLEQALRDQLKDRFGDPENGDPYDHGVWLEDTYPDSVVFAKDGALWRIGYTASAGEVVLADGEPEKVVRSYAPPSAEAPAGDAPASGEVQARAPGFKRLLVTKDDATEQRYVFGIVLEPEPFGGKGDAQEDVYDAATIEAAHRRFMESFQNVGLMHKGYVNDRVKILESYLAPVDFTMKAGDGSDVLIKKGTWLMGAKVLDDELWKACKAGDITGWSIGGSAVRTPEAA